MRTTQCLLKIANWALKFNLVTGGKPAEWVTEIAQKTIRSSSKNPSRAKRPILEWFGLSLNQAEFSRLSTAEMQVRIPPLRFSPLVDRWEQVEGAAVDPLRARTNTRS